jgi:hypothetical protein
MIDGKIPRPEELLHNCDGLSRSFHRKNGAASNMSIVISRFLDASREGQQPRGRDDRRQKESMKTS